MKVPRFDSARVLVIGDIIVDRYWHGATRRLSAEAPIPIVDVNEVEDRPGAAANVAVNVASLGASATLIGMVGADEVGQQLAEKLTAAGIDCRLSFDPNYQTTTKVRIVSRSQQLARADFEQYRPMEHSELVRLAREAMPSASNVLLSDYDKGVLDSPAEVIALAQAQGIAVLVDPKFKDFVHYQGATLIKPNRLELETAIGPWGSEEEMVRRSQELISNLGVEAMLVTRSAQGMTLIKRYGEEQHFPARTREVYDVTGAGDTVMATLCAALGAGQTLNDAIGLANVAAGLVVGHFGITSVSGPELRQELASDAEFARGRMSPEQLKVVVEEARHRGERIVFTNGCFDILHAGHVDYLAEARKQGDRLIVAINSDESVRRLKGPGRPVVTLDHRMTVLAGLAAVDWVVSFDGDTPEALISALRPDVLVKGGDYSSDQVVGGDIVRGYDGEVRVMPLVEDCSTSALVEKIRAS